MFVIHRKKVLRNYFLQLKAITAEVKLRRTKYVDFANKFYASGLKRKSTKGWKLFAFGKVGHEWENLKKRVDLVV